jgi:hypothetical protein
MDKWGLKPPLSKNQPPEPAMVPAADLFSGWQFFAVSKNG